IQPLLLGSVSVELPYRVEVRLFGWLGAGDAPAHAWQAWMSAAEPGALREAVSIGAQLIYLSHMFVLPCVLFLLWRKRTRGALNCDGAGCDGQARFARYVRAFTILHAIALLTYVAMPVAPPWWISLHGIASPSAELVAATNVRDAMHGVVVQG